MRLQPWLNLATVVSVALFVLVGVVCVSGFRVRAGSYTLLWDSKGPLLSAVVFSNCVYLVPGGRYPYWVLFIVTGLLPVVRAVRWWRRPRRSRGFDVVNVGQQNAA